MSRPTKPALGSIGWTLCIYGLVETLAESGSWPVWGVGPAYYLVLIGVSLLGWIWGFRRQLRIAAARFLLIAGIFLGALFIESPLRNWLNEPLVRSLNRPVEGGFEYRSSGPPLYHLLAGISSNLGWLLLGGWVMATAATLVRTQSANGHSKPIFCPSCGYDMRGLTHTTCPECGKEHTLDQLVSRNREAPTHDRGPAEQQPRTQ